MKLAVLRSILYGQACLYAGLLACILLMPSGLAANSGISFYGVHRLTFFPYAVGLLGAAYFTSRASAKLNGNSDLLIPKRAMDIYAPLIIGVVITPYSAGGFMDNLHTLLGTLLFVLQLILSGWFVFRMHYNRVAFALASIELFGGIASAVYIKPAHGLLIQSQIVFQLAFGALLYYFFWFFWTTERSQTPMSKKTPAV